MHTPAACCRSSHVDCCAAAHSSCPCCLALLLRRRPMRLGGGLGGDSRLPKEPRKKILADAAARGVAVPSADDRSRYAAKGWGDTTGAATRCCWWTGQGWRVCWGAILAWDCMAACALQGRWESGACAAGMQLAGSRLQGCQRAWGVRGLTGGRETISRCCSSRKARGERCVLGWWPRVGIMRPRQRSTHPRTARFATSQGGQVVRRDSGY